jgi:glycosyltransferase involved in cell wall biosynthesis
MPTPHHHRLNANADGRPLTVMFVNTSLPVGGAETLLLNLVRRMDRERFAPEICCLKELGPIGELLSADVPTFHSLLRHKYDVGVRERLAQLFTERHVDAVVTIGAGDKMFWGRLAAAKAGVPVVLSALHSTGWPDCIERPNRWLTNITDGFIAVAPTHGRHLIEREGFPADKVFVVPNGVDVFRFRPDLDSSAQREEIGLADHERVVGIVAALRPEKQHALFLEAAAQVRRRVPGTRFLVIGDGPERLRLLALTHQLKLNDAVHFLGNRADVPEWLNLCDVFALSSRMEANPVSILEAMACGVPVVAPRVGSIPDTVADGLTGYLVEPNRAAPLAERLEELLLDGPRRRAMGQEGRISVLANASLSRMVEGYQDLIEFLYARRLGAKPSGNRPLRRPIPETAAV